MFSAPGLVFGVTEGVGFRFIVLRSRVLFRVYRGPLVLFLCSRSRTHFRRFQGRRFPFSCFALSDAFWAVLRTLGLLFMFCAPGLVLGVTEDDRYRFLILRARTHFRQRRECRVPFSCFALPDSFSVVPRASGPIFMFCAPALIISGTEGVGSRFHVLRSRSRFRRYRGRQLTFSCFARPDSFSAGPRASGTVLTFCATGIFFDGA
jgi:hypothetical protein